MKFCSKCKNRKLDQTRGFVCLLTDDYASFDGVCENYTVDTEEEEWQAKQARENEKLYRKRDLKDDLFFFLGIIISFIFGDYSLKALLIMLVISALCFVLSNCLMIQYEKKKGKRIKDNLRWVVKDTFALLVLLLIVFAL